MDKVFHVVIDTNVLVSSLITRNSSAPTVQIIRFLAESRIIPVYSEEIIIEYAEVLRRPKFNLPEVLVNAIINDIASHGIKVTDIVDIPDEMPDPKDTVFYAVAKSLHSEETFLVTGNTKHFPAESQVVTPLQLVSMINANTSSGYTL